MKTPGAALKITAQTPAKYGGSRFKTLHETITRMTRCIKAKLANQTIGQTDVMPGKNLNS